MKKTVNKFAIISFFMLSACSTVEGWFDEEEPLPSELGKRTPTLNSSLPPTFPNPIDAMMPPMADSGMGGGMGVAPEPPAFIGSNGVQPFPSQTPQVSATPIPAAPSAVDLPTQSTVDMSAANNAATGLPVQRRTPEFNQSLAVNLGNKAPTLPAPAVQIPVPLVTKPVVRQLPTAKSGDGFPKLAQIPPAPIAPVSAEIDSRIVQMKADLQVSQDAKVDIPPMPQTIPIEMPKAAPVPPMMEARRPVVPTGVATTNFASLKPLPNEPIYKIADEAQVIAAQPRVLNTQVSMPSQNITNLSNLRPLSGNYNAGRSNISTPAGGKARMGIVRHSTYYGEY